MRNVEATLGPWKASEQPGNDIAVLMSGGVDSSTAALLLKNEGWNVLGVTMKIPVASGCDYRRSCCGTEAAYVCRDLGIPHYFVDVRETFEALVIEPFRRSYLEGRTPSPCVDCNTRLKFGVVWDFIEKTFGVRNLATGHYARVAHSGERTYLARAKDLSKDQSYFLYGVPRERLEHLALPLGDLTKSEVRRIARNARLPVARRPESMELCFAGEGDYRTALGDESSGPGPILDLDGKVIGEHKGIANYTVGQRRGLRVAAGKPLYVIGIDPAENSITVGTASEATTHTVRADEINVLIPEALHKGARLAGKIRSQGDPSPCTVIRWDGSLIEVEFDEAQFAPTPGQHLVLYDDEGNVAAGGVIGKGSMVESHADTEFEVGIAG